MSHDKVSLTDILKEEGYEVKITDGGVIAHQESQTPSRHELVGVLPELKGFPMEQVEEGVFIQVGDEPFPL